MSNYSFFAQASKSTLSMDGLGRGNSPRDAGADEYRALYAALRQQLDVSDRQSDVQPLSSAAQDVLNEMSKKFGVVQHSAYVAD